MFHTEKTLSMLASIKEMLHAKGFNPEVTPKNTLRLELSSNGKLYAIQHIAIAEAIIGDNLALKKGSDNPFWEYHYEELDYDRELRVAVSLLLVGEDSYIYHPDFAMVLERLALDSTSAKKHVCGFSEVHAWAGNPFSPWHAGATDPQVIHVVDLNRREWNAPEPVNAANLMFAREDLSTVSEELLAHPRRGEIQALTSVLFRHIMGTAYQVVWAEDEGEIVPLLGRLPEAASLLRASGGELLAFALSYFLAKAHASARPGLYIHVPNVLYRFDSVRQIAALDCLRDFLVATGASLFMEANNSAVFSAAKNRLTKLTAQ